MAIQEGSGLIFGTDEGEIIRGSGPSIVYAKGGDDAVRPGYSNDVAYLGDGDDVAYGEAGNDLLFGEAGDDLMYGGKGNDWLDRGEGNDLLWGDDGNDEINSFAVENDQIIVSANINDTGIESLADLSDRVNDSEEGAVVDLGEDSQILLTGIAADDVNANMADYFTIA